MQIMVRGATPIRTHNATVPFKAQQTIFIPRKVSTSAVAKATHASSFETRSQSVDRKSISSISDLQSAISTHITSAARKSISMGPSLHHAISEGAEETQPLERCIH